MNLRDFFSFLLLCFWTDLFSYLLTEILLRNNKRIWYENSKDKDKQAGRQAKMFSCQSFVAVARKHTNTNNQAMRFMPTTLFLNVLRKDQQLYEW